MGYGPTDDGAEGVTDKRAVVPPMFQELGPNARGLLAPVAVFPRGVDENDLTWLFSTIPDRVRPKLYISLGERCHQPNRKYPDTIRRSTCEQTLLSGVKTNHNDAFTPGMEIF